MSGLLLLTPSTIAGERRAAFVTRREKYQKTRADTIRPFFLLRARRLSHNYRCCFAVMDAIRDRMSIYHAARVRDDRACFPLLAYSPGLGADGGVYPGFVGSVGPGVGSVGPGWGYGVAGYGLEYGAGPALGYTPAYTAAGLPPGPRRRQMMNPTIAASSSIRIPAPAPMGIRTLVLSPLPVTSISGSSP